MSSAVRPKSKKEPAAASRPRAARPSSTAVPPTASFLRTQPTSEVKQLELVELLHQGAVIEIVIAEVEPSSFEVHLIIAWRFGRSALTMASGQPRRFRSLDSLSGHLKTLGIGSTQLRLELLV